MNLENYYRSLIRRRLRIKLHKHKIEIYKRLGYVITDVNILHNRVSKQNRYLTKELLRNIDIISKELGCLLKKINKY